jgi:hypothetical protein
MNHKASKKESATSNAQFIVSSIWLKGSENSKFSPLDKRLKNITHKIRRVQLNVKSSFFLGFLSALYLFLFADCAFKASKVFLANPRLPFAYTLD